MPIAAAWTTDRHVFDLAVGEHESLEAKALEIHRRLRRAFECPIPYLHSLDPLSELVSSLLSYRTRNAYSGRTFKALRAPRPDWQPVVDADAAEIEAINHAVLMPHGQQIYPRAGLRTMRAARHLSDRSGAKRVIPALRAI